MQKLNKLRLSFNEVCDLLSVKRDSLYRLIKIDNTFPKPIKDGETKQAACYFDYQDILNWHENKKNAA